MAKGRFITLEGGEGAGKSTQAHLLAQHLRQEGIEVVLTREPGGAAGAEDIRTLLVTGSTDRWQPMSETLLHMAARVEHVAHTIKPALEKGCWVVCDRFIDSTRVYQGQAQGVGMEIVDALHNIALQGLMPDLTLVLDLPVKDGLARALERGEEENRYESMGTDFHETLRTAFRNLSEKEPDRCLLIDASKPKEQVSAAIWQMVAPLLQGGQ